MCPGSAWGGGGHCFPTPSVAAETHTFPVPITLENEVGGGPELVSVPSLGLEEGAELAPSLSGSLCCPLRPLAGSFRAVLPWARLAGVHQPVHGDALSNSEAKLEQPFGLRSPKLAPWELFPIAPVALAQLVHVLI